MSKRTHVTKNLTPAPTTIIFYNLLTLAVIYFGYEFGAKFVRDNYFEGPPMDHLLGANPGAVITYGVSMQLFADFNRTPWGRRLNERLSQTCINRLFSGSASRQSAILYGPLATGDQFLLKNNINDVTWSKSCGDILKIIMLRLMHYGAAIGTGVAVIGLPIYFMFNGEGIEASSTQIDCKVFTAICFLVEFGLYLAASRSDNYSGVVLEEITAENEEEVFHTVSSSAMFGGSEHKTGDDLDYREMPGDGLESQKFTFPEEDSKSSWCSIM